MSANQQMALRVVWGTRIDDDTPAPDARELLAMCGLIEPGGHEILPDRCLTGRLLDEQGRPVATAPPATPAQPKPRKKKAMGRTPIPTEHGTDHGYQQHKRKREPIPADDSCGCQAAHDAQLIRRPRTPEPHSSSSVLPPENHADAISAPPILTVVPDAPEPDIDQGVEPTTPVDLHAQLLGASQSPKAAVRRSAARALDALEQLHDALDDLARAERGRP